MKLKCLIVDDETMARKALEKLCSKLDSLEVVGICANGNEAVAAMSQQEVDVMFLDIHMPDLSGLDMVKSLRNLPQIIFTTGDPEHALAAFEYNVTDYLIKPISLPRLMQAVAKAQQITQSQAGELAEDKADKHFFIKVDSRFVKLDFDELLWVESFGDYIQFFTKNKKYTVHMTLKKVQERLPAERFFRIHRQYIINLEKVVDIQDNSVLINDKVIPISRSHKEGFMKKLNLL